MSQVHKCGSVPRNEPLCKLSVCCSPFACMPGNLIKLVTLQNAWENPRYKRQQYVNSNIYLFYVFQRTLQNYLNTQCGQ